jgi:hypothetical protein
MKYDSGLKFTRMGMGGAEVHAVGSNVLLVATGQNAGYCVVASCVQQNVLVCIAEVGAMDAFALKNAPA